MFFVYSGLRVHKTVVETSIYEMTRNIQNDIRGKKVVFPDFMSLIQFVFKDEIKERCKPQNIVCRRPVSC